MNKNYIKRGASYLKRNGIKKSFYKAAERMVRDKDEAAYDFIAKNSSADEETLKLQRERRFERAYKFSILVPVYETREDLFKLMLKSVGDQTYTNWELILVDTSKTDVRRNIVRDFCEEYYLKVTDSFGTIHDKVKYIYLDKNKGIAGNTNEALLRATGDYVALLDHDDALSKTALFDVIWHINEQELVKEDGIIKLKRIVAVYTDEDKVNEDDTKYFDCHKKPDFDPVLLCTNNYICHLFVVDVNLAKSVGGFRSDFDGAQDHDFILRCTEGLKKEQIIHIPKVLYHWRSSDASTATNPSAKLYAYKSGKRAVAEYLLRQGIKAKVTDTEHLGFYRVNYEKKDAEVALIETEDYEKKSSGQLENISGEFIMLKSSELKPVNPEYIDVMLGCMQLAGIGAVAGKIIDKKGRIESAGFDVKEGKKVPRFSGLNGRFSGYLHRASIQQLVGGFSQDAVLIRKDAVESFKPCIKLKKGYDVYFEPEAIFKRKLL